MMYFQVNLIFSLIFIFHEKEGIWQNSLNQLMLVKGPYYYKF